MPGESIFADDWRDCLKAHYSYIVHEQDVRTERTLLGVMQDVGFNEDELKELRVHATMHIDDVGADFVPDLEILELKAEEVALAEEAQAQPPQDDLPVEELIEEEIEPEAPPAPHDEAGPAQLSLF